MKKLLINILKITLVVFPLWFIISRIQLTEFTVAIHKVSLWTIPLFLLVTLSVIAMQGFRWWLLIVPFAPDVTLLKTMSSHFAAQFYSIVLPTSAAQDFIRASLLSGCSDKSVPWAATFITRLNGLLVLFLFSLVGVILIGKSVFPPNVVLISVVLFVIFLILTFFSFSKKITRPVRIFLEKKIPHKIMFILTEIRQAIYNYRQHKKILAVNFFVTVLTQFLSITTAIILIYGVTGKIYFVETLAFIPIIEIITISLPLTPGGIGVRDILVAGYFGFLQLSMEQAGVYIILSYLGVAMKLTGIIPIVVEKTLKRAGRIS